jgi:hypothetical protein
VQAAIMISPAEPSKVDERHHSTVYRVTLGVLGIRPMLKDAQGAA